MVLKEFEEREAEKDQRLAKARAEEKAAIEAQKEKVEVSRILENLDLG